jgi:hypothetical protein
MLIVREIFTAKPGQASKLAKLFRKAMPEDQNMTIMTDLVSDFNTIIVEYRVNNLAEFEKQMEEYKSGKPDPKMDQDVAKELSNYTEMYLTGRREIYQIVD